MTWENRMFRQISSAFSRSPCTISAPLSAPTEVPETALMRMPASRSARQAPI